MLLLTPYCIHLSMPLWMVRGSRETGCSVPTGRGPGGVEGRSGNWLPGAYRQGSRGSRSEKSGNWLPCTCWQRSRGSRGKERELAARYLPARSRGNRSGRSGNWLPCAYWQETRRAEPVGSVWNSCFIPPTLMFWLAIHAVTTGCLTNQSGVVWLHCIVPAPQQDQYRSSRVRYRSSRARYRSSRVRYRSSRARYWSSRARYRSSRVRYRSSGVRYRSSRVRYLSSRVRYW